MDDAVGLGCVDEFGYLGGLSEVGFVKTISAAAEGLAADCSIGIGG